MSFLRIWGRVQLFYCTSKHIQTHFKNLTEKLIRGQQSQDRTFIDEATSGFMFGDSGSYRTHRTPQTEADSAATSVKRESIYIFLYLSLFWIFVLCETRFVQLRDAWWTREEDAGVHVTHRLDLVGLWQKSSSHSSLQKGRGQWEVKDQAERRLVTDR